MSHSLLLRAFLVGILLASAALAQDAPKSQRALLLLKHVDANTLAGALAKHFKGDAEIQAVPGTATNCLLVRAEPAVIQEVAKLLAELDRAPRTVAVELLCIDVPAKAGADAKGPDEKEFTGPIKDVMERVEALRKKGQLGNVRRFEFPALEQQPVTIMVGESKPYSTGMAGAGRAGIMTRTINYRDVGTRAKVTAQVVGEKTITLEVDVSHSSMHQTPENGVVIGKDDNGAPVYVPEFVSDSLKTKLSIASGQAVAAKEMRTTSKAGQARTLFVLTARIAEAEAKRGK